VRDSQRLTGGKCESTGSGGSLLAMVLLIALFPPSLPDVLGTVPHLVLAYFLSIPRELELEVFRDSQ
jgi:hypothetical protein